MKFQSSSGKVAQAKKCGLWFHLAIFILATSSCSNTSSDKKNNTDGGAPEKNSDGTLSNGSPSDGSPGSDKKSGSQPIGTKLPTTTGNLTADKFLQAVLSCGYQSSWTVPAGWEMVLVGERGCAVWAPAGWQAQGAGTGMTFIQSGNSGYLSMMGVPQAGVYVNCTPQGVSDFMKQNIEQWNCTNVKFLYYKEGVENIAGVQIPKADVIFSCTTNGVLKVGYLWNTIQGTMPLCNLLILGFWMPESEIAAKACTLTQIFNSARCPGPGGTSCSDSECNADCVKQGKTGGSCTSNDDCECN